MPQFQILDRQPGFAELLGASLGQNIGGGFSQGLQNQIANFQNQKKLQVLEEQFKQQGYPDDLAMLAASASKGGETAVLKEVLEERKRRKSPTLSNFPEKQSLKDIVESGNTGYAPAELNRVKSERYKSGLPVYEKAIEKIHSSKSEKDLLNVIEKLNQTDKLPQNLGRINVDKDGNLRVPFFANAETERFIKTLNEFSKNAKDTYGSRVTNFDLQQFMKRYPTLLNTKEGRKQIVEQMNLVNKINRVYYKELKNVFKESGGVRNIDTDQALAVAEERSENKVNQLRKRFADIGSNIKSALPNPKEFKGKKFLNEETGEILISNGIEWIPGQ